MLMNPEIAEIPPIPAPPWLNFAILAGISIVLIVFALWAARRKKNAKVFLGIGMTLTLGLVPLALWMGSNYLEVDVKPWMRLREQLPKGFFIDLREHLDLQTNIMTLIATAGSLISFVLMALGFAKVSEKKKKG